MSLVFDGNLSENVVTIDSPNLAAFSWAGWINLVDYGPGGFGSALFVKDAATYRTWLGLNFDGTLLGAAGAPYLGGINTFTVIGGGTGYVLHDTGVVTGGNPDTSANRATYIVNSLSGSTVLTVGIPAAGQGYAVGTTYSTAKAGAQPGVGSGLTIRPDTLVNIVGASSQSTDIVPLGVWTHVAMTWDSAADKLVHLYINGVEVTYDPAIQRTISNTPDGTTGPWVFGGDSLVEDFDLDGSMAEVVVYSSALSGAQIAALAASTTGSTGSPLNYWHFCSDIPALQTDVINGNNGTLSIPPPTAGSVSPGFNCIASVATKETIAIGEFGGNALAEAFFNPSHYDLIQVLNEGGDVVWNLDYAGTANVDPTSPTRKALIGSYFGETFALAFPNPYSMDIFQIIGQGDNVVYWVDSNGVAHTA